MELIVTFKSSHQAIYGEDVLLENEINVKVMPLPSPIRSGCGLCLRVSKEDIFRTLELFEDNKVLFEHIYTKFQDNSYKEWTDNNE